MSERMNDMSIVEFLLARIAEDEADWKVVDARDEVLHLHGKPLAPKMLAECEAKRTMVKKWVDIENGFLDCPHALDADEMLRVLASLYADHPDYDEAVARCYW